MTVKCYKKNNKKELSFKHIIAISAIAFLLVFTKEAKTGFNIGLSLSINNILPTLFPFLILADYWVTIGCNNTYGKLGNLFAHLFGLPPSSFRAFMLGSIFGFPIGVKAASEMYIQGELSKEETERLVGFVNNPSAAYVISGVGLGLYGSISIGLKLYFITLSASIIVAIIFRKKGNFKAEQRDIIRQSFDLVTSIKSAGITSIQISSYIVFFSVISSIFNSIIKNNILMLLISSFLEVSGAVSNIYETLTFSVPLKLSLTAFALGFSGLSVHLQSFSFMPSSISKKKYILMKLMQGVIAFLITFLFCFLK